MLDLFRRAYRLLPVDRFANAAIREVCPFESDLGGSSVREYHRRQRNDAPGCYYESEKALQP